jgi:hypothetical protein
MRDLLVAQVHEDALEDVPHVLEVDGERDDLGPAAAVALVERLAADLREVELDRGVEAVDVVVHGMRSSMRAGSLSRITCSMPFSICSMASTRRRSAPYTRRMPVRTMCVPHTMRATLARKLSSVCPDRQFTSA